MATFVGSSEHKELLCRFFVESHDPYDPAQLIWPRLDESTRDRLRGLPIWEEAVKIEAETALAVTTMGEVESDPMLAKAISLQGYEEARHAELLRLLTREYGIPVPEFFTERPADPSWAFMRIGYAECFDSFFAFGLFALARDSGFFPREIVGLFEPVMQEEGRHIIFHVNWVAYNQASRGLVQRPPYVFRRGLAMCLQLLSRLRTATRIKGKSDKSDQSQHHFTMSAHESLGEISPRDFLQLCLAENERRLSRYDQRLLRPTFVPAVARAVLSLLPRDRVAAPVAGQR